MNEIQERIATVTTETLTSRPAAPLIVIAHVTPNDKADRRFDLFVDFFSSVASHIIGKLTTGAQNIVGTPMFQIRSRVLTQNETDRVSGTSSGLALRALSPLPSCNGSINIPSSSLFVFDEFATYHLRSDEADAASIASAAAQGLLANIRKEQHAVEEVGDMIISFHITVAESLCNVTSPTQSEISANQISLYFVGMAATQHTSSFSDTLSAYASHDKCIHEEKKCSFWSPMVELLRGYLDGPTFFGYAEGKGAASFVDEMNRNAQNLVERSVQGLTSSVELVGITAHQSSPVIVSQQLALLETARRWHQDVIVWLRRSVLKDHGEPGVEKDETGMDVGLSRDADALFSPLPQQPGMLKDTDTRKTEGESREMTVLDSTLVQRLSASQAPSDGMSMPNQSSFVDVCRKLNDDEVDSELGGAGDAAPHFAATYSGAPAATKKIVPLFQRLSIPKGKVVSPQHKAAQFSSPPPRKRPPLPVSPAAVEAGLRDEVEYLKGRCALLEEHLIIAVHKISEDERSKASQSPTRAANSTDNGNEWADVVTEQRCEIERVSAELQRAIATADQLSKSVESLAAEKETVKVLHDAEVLRLRHQLEFAGSEHRQRNESLTELVERAENDKIRLQQSLKETLLSLQEAHNERGALSASMAQEREVHKQEIAALELKLKQQAENAEAEIRRSRDASDEAHGVRSTACRSAMEHQIADLSEKIRFLQADKKNLVNALRCLEMARQEEQQQKGHSPGGTSSTSAQVDAAQLEQRQAVIAHLEGELYKSQRERMKLSDAVADLEAQNQTLRASLQLHQHVEGADHRKQPTQSKGSSQYAGAPAINPSAILATAQRKVIAERNSTRQLGASPARNVNSPARPGMAHYVLQQPADLALPSRPYSPRR